MPEMKISSGDWKIVQQTFLRNSGWEVEPATKSASVLKESAFKKGEQRIHIREQKPGQPPLVRYTDKNGEQKVDREILVFVLAAVQYYEYAHEIRVTGFTYEKAE